MKDASLLVLRAAGASIVVDVALDVPSVLHWGADLGDPATFPVESLRDTALPAVLNNSPDVPRTLTLWPTEHQDWAGTPAQEGDNAGAATTPRPVLESFDYDPNTDRGGSIQLHLIDLVTRSRGRISIVMDPDGVLALTMSIRRDDSLTGHGDPTPYSLRALRMLLPLPERAVETLDFTGKWCRERSPQKAPLNFGTSLRRSRRGKSGHDSPFLLVAATRELGFGSGEGWGVHLAWSGDSEYFTERLPEGAGAFSSVLGVGESLRPGEVLLDDGDTYVSPTAYFIWTDSGLDGIAQRMHRHLRSRPQHPTTPRPLTLNSWEAVYFDHDLERLKLLIERGARVGVERFVLDDGWFARRRGAVAGLGDWYVDKEVWPDGLHPLVDIVRANSMQFGLWFEPEMINLDSDLARAHPEWILGPEEGLGSAARDQYVLNISRPEAYAYVFERVSELVDEYSIDYIKWDHNRDLSEAVGRERGSSRPAVRAQTLSLYRMLDDLRARHPLLEIETCSGGGGRVDLGVLGRTDRVWASDCNDPVERLQVERWTRMLIPPELIGSHLGAERSHTTSRRTDLSFRLAVALTAHAGIEWDLQGASEDELDHITVWSDMYREFRHLIGTGRVVNADLSDDATMLSGIVSQDGRRSLYTWARLASSAAGQSGRVRIPGLDPTMNYSLRVRTELGNPSRHQARDPEWMERAIGVAGLNVSGAVLSLVGIPMPTLNPQQAMLIEIESIDDPTPFNLPN